MVGFKRIAGKDYLKSKSAAYFKVSSMTMYLNLKLTSRRYSLSKINNFRIKCFLGVLYGLGKQSLADRLECSVQESEDIIQGLYKSFPKLREYVDIQSQYPLDNNGYVNTMLGDKLQLPEFTEYLPKAKDDRERNNIIAKIRRLGVNLPIQGGTSSIMSSGFFNDIRVSLDKGWTVPLQPIITVEFYCCNKT